MMSISNSIKTVLACIFVEGETKGNPSSGRIYHYFVPDYLANAVPSFKPGSHVIVKGGDNRNALARVDRVITGDLVSSSKATKPIIGTVDLDAYDRRREEQQRARDIITALTRIDRQRRQRERFEKMAGDDLDAQKLLKELDDIPLADLDDDH